MDIYSLLIKKCTRKDHLLEIKIQLVCLAGRISAGVIGQVRTDLLLAITAAIQFCNNSGEKYISKHSLPLTLIDCRRIEEGKKVIIS